MYGASNGAGGAKHVNGLVGTISKQDIDSLGRFYGAYGAVPGYSGGGVFDKYDRLIGICRGGKNYPEYFTNGKRLDNPIDLAEYAGHADLVAITPGQLAKHNLWNVDKLIRFDFQHLDSNSVCVHTGLELAK